MVGKKDSPASCCSELFVFFFHFAYDLEMPALIYTWWWMQRIIVAQGAEYQWQLGTQSQTKYFLSSLRLRERWGRGHRNTVKAEQ